MNNAQPAMPYSLLSVRKTTGTQTTTAVLGATVTIEFDVTDLVLYSFVEKTSLTQITVRQKGVYAIGYDIKQSAGNNDTGTMVLVQKNGVTIPQSRSYGYTRATAAECPSCATMFLIDCNANDVLTCLSENREAVAHTVQPESIWWVELVRVLP